jgi:Bacterial Ig-like domain
MNPMKAVTVLFLMCCLFACGDQIVEFKTDAGVGVGVDGRADASVDAPADLPPIVISTVPADGATGVARDATILATFSEAMDPTTITMLTFVVTRGATPVTGAVAFDGPSHTATFTPTVPLLANLMYTATITTGAKDLAGRALAASHTWQFTTGANVNDTPPRVIFTSPAALATNVSVNKRPTATFNKAMDPATLTDLTFTLAQGLTPVPGTVSYDPATNTAMLSPLAPLAIDTVYTATITTGARDTRGGALPASYVWTFTTGACGQGLVVLGASASFGVLAGSTVTSTGLTSVTAVPGLSARHPRGQLARGGPGRGDGDGRPHDRVQRCGRARAVRGDRVRKPRWDDAPARPLQVHLGAGDLVGRPHARRPG